MGRQQAAQQRTEQRGDAAGQTADIQNLHDAAPKAEDAGHRKAQLQSGLGTVQRGGGHGAEVPVKKAPKEGEDHQTGPDIRHCHRSTLPSIDFEKWVHCTLCGRRAGHSENAELEVVSRGIFKMRGTPREMTDQERKRTGIKGTNGSQNRTAPPLHGGGAVYVCQFSDSAMR